MLKVKPYYPTFPEGKQKVFTMSYDDGNDCDIPLIELMRAYGIKATFNVNSALWSEKVEPYRPGERWRRMTPEQARSIYGTDMEVAVHGAWHPFWAEQKLVRMTADILDDRRALEKLMGYPIRGSASPYGSFNRDTEEALRLSGIEYCRMGAKATYDFRAIPENFLELQPTCKYSDPRLMELAEKFVTGNGIRNYQWMFYVWGHSYEHIRDNDWQIVENLVKYVSRRDDVWYATNIEIVDYVNASRRLRYNLDRTFVENPTDVDVWLRTKPLAQEDPGIVRIPAGGHVELG